MGSEEGEPSQEVLIHLAESRSQMYDGFASDSLTLLGIQLTVLPISLAAASFVTSINQSPDFGAVRWDLVVMQITIAGILFAISVVLSFDVYRQSRRGVYTSLDLLRGVCYTGSEDKEIELDGIRKELANQYQSISKAFQNRANEVHEGLRVDLFPETPSFSAGEKLRRELGTAYSDENIFHVQLMMSISTTFLSSLLFISGILTSVGELVFAFILILVFLCVLFSGTAIIYAMPIAIFAHSPLRSLISILALSLAYLAVGSHWVQRRLRKTIK